MATQATYDDVNLILRLFDLRREERLRKAREWFGATCSASSLEELQSLAPPGSQENAYLRMVTSYWEMAASFVTAGVLDQDLFFQSGGELLFVWERMRELVPALRASTKNPHAYHNLEIVGNAFIKWMEGNGPEAYPSFQAMVKSAAARKS
ncbi:MAG: hypothetical protein ABSC23_15175 [Bryobacteraceae bacterium]|jgi:hypothetical protein